MREISVLYLSQVSVIPGIGNRPHTHDYWHFCLTTAGSMKTDRGSIQHAPWCDLWPAGALNAGAFYTETTRSFNVLFVVHDKTLYNRLEAFQIKDLSSEELHIPVLESILEQARILNPGQAFIDYAFGYYLHLLLASGEKTNSNNSRKPTLVDKALAFIEENYMHQIRLEDVANYIDRSPYHTSHLIKTSTGLTVVEHIRDVRLKNACMQLAYSRVPLDEIINACGFVSASYFHRIFKDTIGTTPNRYRTSHVVNDTFYLGNDSSLDIPYKDTFFTYIPGALKCINWKTPREYYTQAAYMYNK